MDFSAELLKWYHRNKRDLPWRNTSDPYLIWLSEIILQQTRVDQGLPYYLKFAEHFPDVASFAAADEDTILKLWQGLGYYSRGRNMLKTAQNVVQNYNGAFPTSYKELIKLTGIGEYTAAAISSFSVNEARAVVDGNVYRLLARLFGISTPINSTEGKKTFQKLADSLLDKDKAGEHNQAIIEFGALQCRPKNPQCDTCPFFASCYARKENQINELPVKLKTLKIKERHFYYFVIVKENKILLNRRANDDIWAGLHDFPLIESAHALTHEELLAHENFKNWFGDEKVIFSMSGPVKHILTHQRIFGTFIESSGIKEDIAEKHGWFWIDLDDLSHYGQPKLIFAFLKNFHKLNEI